MADGHSAATKVIVELRFLTDRHHLLIRLKDEETHKTPEKKRSKKVVEEVP